jgi:hypothetical protein
VNFAFAFLSRLVIIIKHLLFKVWHQILLLADLALVVDHSQLTAMRPLATYLGHIKVAI